VEEKRHFQGECSFCGHSCDICCECGKSCCDHCGSHCNCHKKKCKCNLCEKVTRGQCVLILTKNNNLILGTIDRIYDCTTLKIANSLTLPTCVICSIIEGLLEGLLSRLAANQNNAGLSICDLLALFLPFDTFVCCNDIDTITVLNGSLLDLQNYLTTLSPKLK